MSCYNNFFIGNGVCDAQKNRGRLYTWALVQYSIIVIGLFFQLMFLTFASRFLPGDNNDDSSLPEGDIAPFMISPGDSKVHQIETINEFNSVVNTGKVVVIDFYATWCHPCKIASPLYTNLAAEYEGANIIFCRADVDKARALTALNKVNSKFKFDIMLETRILIVYLIS